MAAITEAAQGRAKIIDFDDSRRKASRLLAGTILGCAVLGGGLTAIATAVEEIIEDNVKESTPITLTVDELKRIQAVRDNAPVDTTIFQRANAALNNEFNAEGARVKQRNQTKIELLASGGVLSFIGAGILKPLAPRWRGPKR